jgi:endonuclease G, mitochondrial
VSTRLLACALGVILAAGCAHAPTGAEAQDATTRPVDGVGQEPAAPGPLAGSVHVALGVPVDLDPSDDVLLDRQHWVASYNPRRLVPNWVSWRVVATDLGAAARQDNFRADAMLPAGLYRVKPTDYQKSGYDRGHMCPSADRTASVEANSATFLMTNMQPQLPALNRGPWKDLESFSRMLVRSGKEVQIVTGGVFEGATTTIGPGIAVPSANFKVVVVLDPGQGVADVTVDTTVYAIVMPNARSISATRWTQYLVSVDEVERRTGYDLLSDVRDDVENVIEARVAPPP